MYPSPVSSSTVGISSPNGFPTSLGSPSIVIRAEENGYSPTMATQSIYRATTSASRRARATGQYHSAPTPPPAPLYTFPARTRWSRAAWPRWLSAICRRSRRREWQQASRRSWRFWITRSSAGLPEPCTRSTPNTSSETPRPMPGVSKRFSRGASALVKFDCSVKSNRAAAGRLCRARCTTSVR